VSPQEHADDDNVRRIHRDDLVALLEDAAEKGAKRALASVGLHDDDAHADVLELRGLVEAFRTVKKSILQTVGKALTMAILGGLLLLGGKYWGGNQ
jgi:predicted xylose isomerase-like sugar epimerase